MKFNIVTLVLLCLFIYPIVKGFIFKFSSNNMKRQISGIEGSISFVLALFFSIYLTKKIFLQHEFGIYKTLYESIPLEIINYIEVNPFSIYVTAFPLITLVVYKIIFLILNGLNKIMIYPVFDAIERAFEKKSVLLKRIMGAVVEIPRAICYVLVLTFLLNMTSMFSMENNLNRALESSKLYKLISKEVIVPLNNSKVAKQLPNIINNSFKVVVKEADAKEIVNNKNTNKKVIVYYNGVTLDEGVKSNSKIDNFAKTLGSKEKDSKAKAKAIYSWIGSNINYDNDKANRVLSNDFNINSGAIPTFETKSGICFDYACLYVAMARANNLKVRIITGEGFNGVSWVSHAWNEVYIPEENKWIKVDPTFYKGGNYFNSKRFDIDHKSDNIAGEW